MLHLDIGMFFAQLSKQEDKENFMNDRIALIDSIVANPYDRIFDYSAFSMQDIEEYSVIYKAIVEENNKLYAFSARLYRIRPCAVSSVAFF